MKENTVYMLLLILSTLLIIFVNRQIKKSKPQTQLKKTFSINFGLVILWNISLILQICFSKYISAIYFDYIAYIGICFLPISLLFTGKIFANTKIKFKSRHLLLFVIPLISLLILWTNDLHHLFYIEYSTNPKETVFRFIFYNTYSL